MAINFKDIEIATSVENPFEGDKLNRRKTIIQLTSLLRGLGEYGCVMALNGEWGSGKTTTVSMWRNYIASSEINGKSLYFNAWENDYVENPMVALIAEMKALFHDNPLFESIITKGSRIAVKIGGALLKAGVKKYTGLDCDSINSGIDELASIYSERIASYDSEKKELEDFKKALSEFVADNSSEFPVVFFIDELDRCNPHYAVRVLECVKHLFDVPNIVFVLATNLNQLQYAIQGFYGSNKIDGREYLKRFIDFEFTIPEPNIKDYALALYDRHGFDDFFGHNQRAYDRELSSQADLFKQAIGDLLSAYHLNLRTTNKIMTYSRLALMGFPIRSLFSSDVFFFLCLLKNVEPRIYDKIKAGEYSIQSLYTELENVLPSVLFTDEDFGFTTRHMAWLIANLLFCYNYSSRGMEREKDFVGKENPQTKKMEFPIKTQRIDREQFFEALAWSQSGRLRNSYNGLKMYFDRIDLLDNIDFGL